MGKQGSCDPPGQGCQEKAHWDVLGGIPPYREGNFDALLANLEYNAHLSSTIFKREVIKLEQSEYNGRMEKLSLNR